MVPSIRRWLLALVRPDRAFEEWRPSFRLAAAAVIVLALVNAAGVAASAGSVERAASGTIVVDNPDRPSDTFCEMESEDSMFNDSEVLSGTPTGCANEPRTIEKRLGPITGNAATGMAFVAFFVTIIGWLLVAAAVALVVQSEEHGGFGELLTVAGWGTIPAVLRYAARPVFVERAAESWNHPGTIEALQPAARAFVAGGTARLFAIVVGVTLLWQAVIYAYGFAAVTDASFGRTAAIAGVPALVLAGLFVGGGDLPASELRVYGVALFVFGLPSAAAPYWLTRLSEQLDAIGSTRRWGDVEPAGWNVRLTRATGVAMLAGAFWLLGGPLFV